MTPVDDSAQMEAALGSSRVMELAQNAASLSQAFTAPVQQPKIQQHFVDYALPNIQQINLAQGAKSFIEPASSVNFNQIQMASPAQEQKQTINNTLVPLNEPIISNNFNNLDLKQVQAPAEEDDVICISKNKNMIKKRSFVELRKRSQHES